MICEYTGVAETEALAHQVLVGKEAHIGKAAYAGLPYIAHDNGVLWPAEGANDYAPVTIL